MPEPKKPIRHEPFSVQTKAFNPAQHPSIRAAGVFSPDGYILLNDLKGSAEIAARRRLAEFASAEQSIFHVVSARDLTRTLLDQIKKAKLEPKTTVVVYPGEGARTVFEFVHELIRREPKRYGSLRFLVEKPIFLRTERRAKQKGIFDVRIETPPLMSIPFCHNILVVDDVISSGQTMAKLKQQITHLASQELQDLGQALHLRAHDPAYSRAVTIGNARWLGASWLTVEPTKKRPLQTQQEFDSIVTARLVRHTSGLVPPINSISTFLRRDAKGAMVRQGYRGNISQTRLAAKTILELRKRIERQQRRTK